MPNHPRNEARQLPIARQLVTKSHPRSGAVRRFESSSVRGAPPARPQRWDARHEPALAGVRPRIDGLRLDARSERKDRSDAEIYGFSAGFRKAFDGVIGELARAGHLMVDALNTDRVPIEQSASHLLSTLQQRRNGH